MDNYKEYLELHLVGLLDLNSVVKAYVETKFNIVLIDTNHELNTNYSQLYLLKDIFNVYLICYITEVGPKFVIASNSNYDLVILPISLYTIEQKIMIKHMLHSKNISISVFKTVDIVNDYALDLSLLNLDIIEEAIEFIRQYILYYGKL